LINQPIRLPGLILRMCSGQAPGVCSGLILHFDKFIVLSSPKEAALFTPI
jgi:hypothetical protein